MNARAILIYRVLTHEQSRRATIRLNLYKLSLEIIEGIVGCPTSRNEVFMKTIANCNLEEFLSQTNKIRKKVAEYYKICKIGSIRKIMPAFEDNDTPEDKAKKIQEQGLKNFGLILDECLEQHPKETIEIIGLFCFMSYEEARVMDAGEFLDIALELFSAKRVQNFLSLMANLEKRPSGNISQK